VSRSPSPSTSSLLAACASARAEEAPWNLLVDRLGPPVRGGVLGALALCRESGDPDLVDELVQEVWCRLLERERRVLALCRGTSDHAVLGYVRRVAARVAVDVLRAGGARKRRPLHLASLDDPERALPPAADGRSCPERSLLARERIDGLLGLCRELLGHRAHADRVRIVRLAWLEGRSSTEIAAELPGWTVTGIDSLLHRLRRRLAARGVLVPRRPGERAATRRVERGDRAAPREELQ